MQELATFSIETDSTILLQYKNGRKKRVRFAELAKHALSVDIEKIRAAYRLRTSFISTHMPKARMILMVLLGAGVLGLTAVAGQQALAQLSGKPVQIQPSVTGHEDVARSLAEPSVQPVAVHSSTVETVNKTVRATHILSGSVSKRRGKSDQEAASSNEDPKPEPSAIPAAEIVQPTITPETSPDPTPSSSPATDTSRP